jgi:hypothetical protein
MLKFNSPYIGSTIIDDMNNNIVNVESIKVRICKKIDPHSVYTFKQNNGKITIEKDSKSWGISAEEYKDLQREGLRIFDEIFGDLFRKNDDLGLDK